MHDKNVIQTGKYVMSWFGHSLLFQNPVIFKWSIHFASLFQNSSKECQTICPPAEVNLQVCCVERQRSQTYQPAWKRMDEEKPINFGGEMPKSKCRPKSYENFVAATSLCWKSWKMLLSWSNLPWGNEPRILCNDVRGWLHEMVNCSYCR